MHERRMTSRTWPVVLSPRSYNRSNCPLVNPMKLLRWPGLNPAFVILKQSTLSCDKQCFFAQLVQVVCCQKPFKLESSSNSSSITPVELYHTSRAKFAPSSNCFINTARLKSAPNHVQNIPNSRHSLQ